MSHKNIIRAWKDGSFRNSLSEKEPALLLKIRQGWLNLQMQNWEMLLERNRLLQN